MAEDKRRRSKYMAYGSKRKRGGASIPIGRQGFLITCDGGRERQCSRECINLLERYFEDLGGVISVAEDENAEGEQAAAKSSDASEKNFDELLKEEIVELRDKKNDDWKIQARFVSSETGCNGVVFIEMVKASIGPVELAESIVRMVASTKKSRTRFCMKLLPMEVTCYASAEEVKIAAQPLILKHFPAEAAEGTKFAVVYEARANTGLDRMTLIDAVAQLVPKPHSVDLKAPQKTIIVQVAKTTCGIGVLSGYKELAKYNLRQLVLPPEDEEQKQTKEEEEEEPEVFEEEAEEKQ
ncbi:hypothetical protein SELMODRAFT_405908 [Selaginella moellendorffii]|uniref:THUMP domain-containing protein n=1 Tax=Selaginella moellendorffii TaxID=88036 RepID=D8R025_SELML|nr:hypothetical protein SELMODRAFT_405908 [Selaginella moellendorffii]